MSDPTTSYMGLVKPTVGDPNGSGAWGDKLNGNMDTIEKFAQLDAVDGCCRFVYSSASACQLIPRNGNRLWVGGYPRNVPTMNPIQLSNAGLAANTLYYVYAYMDTSTPPVMKLEASPIVYVDDGAGHACKTGDTSRRCVGMVLTDINGAFRDDANFNAMWVLSYFHRRTRVQFRDFDVVASSSVLTPLIPDARFLMWGDEIAELEITGGVKNDTVGANSQTQITFDGDPIGTIQVNNYGTASTGRGSCQTKIPVRGAAGLHTSGMLGSIQSGTAEWKMQQHIHFVG